MVNLRPRKESTKKFIFKTFCKNDSVTSLIGDKSDPSYNSFTESEDETPQNFVKHFEISLCRKRASI